MSSQQLCDRDRYLVELHSGGYDWVIGADECGTGAWAGPTCVCAAVVPTDWYLEGLNDSKKLTRKSRSKLFDKLHDTIEYFWTFSSPEELDAEGLNSILNRDFQKCISALAKDYKKALIVIDGNLQRFDGPSLVFPRADGLCPAVMAASVLGKVTRDRYMIEMDELYPGYNFKANVGYGVQGHQRGIEKLGITPLHRRSYGPIRKYIAEQTASLRV